MTRQTLIACLLLLAGCGAQEFEISPEDKKLINERYHVYTQYITVIHLEDGTRCAMTTNGGIDCDWKKHGLD